MPASAVRRHFTKCFIAGIVALLPVAGTVLSIVYIEMTIAESWLARQPWYLPGMGIVAVAIVVYLLGLTVSTFIGRWFWRTIDRIIDRLPLLGMLYRTLKQVLGYGEGRDALFQHVVLVPSRENDAVELGLVTNEIVDDMTGAKQLAIFIPGAPTPTAGRLVMMEEAKVRRIAMPVSDSLKAIVSVGKTLGNEKT